MSKSTTPKSKWYEQYEREYKRINQAIRRQQKLGYYVPEEVKPVKPSAMPKILKKDVDKLVRLTPKAIRKKSYWIDSDTGEAFLGLDIVKSNHKPKPSSAKTRKSSNKKKRKPKTKKAQNIEPEIDVSFYPDDIEEWPEQHRQYYPGFTNIAITGYLKQLEQFPNAEGAKILSDWLSRCIDKFGRDRTAQMLDEGSRAGNIVTWETVYKGGVQAYITDMLEYMPEVTDDDRTSFGEIMEEMESWEGPV